MVHTDPWRTVKFGAEYLHVTEMTVYRKIWSGELPAVRVGGRSIRIRQSALDALCRPVVA